MIIAEQIEIGRCLGQHDLIGIDTGLKPFLTCSSSSSASYTPNRARITERLMRLVLTLEQPIEHPQIARQLVVTRRHHQGTDLGTVTLPVPVDTAVALLDRDQRPRQIEMHHLMALAVQVHTLRRHVARQQHPHVGLLKTEILDDIHLAKVGHRPVQHGDLLVAVQPGPGSSSANQSSVAMRSEKITTRVGDFLPTPTCCNSSTSRSASTCGRPLRRPG